MHSKYKIIVIVLSLLFILSIGISVINYKISLNTTQKQLITQSLPLSVNNIYTQIQKQLIEPYLISSMMANDTFVIDWLQKEEASPLRIQKYLEGIKNRHGLLNTFLVSDKTHNYYTQNGFLEKINSSNKDNSWYFTLKDSPIKTEINIDLNKKLSSEPIIFINFKMFDKDYHYLGVTGVALKFSHIQEMFAEFKDQYHLNVCFLDSKGNYILLQHSKNLNTNLKDIPELFAHREELLSKQNKIIEYQKDKSTHIITTKYIQELDAHILVEAKLDDFTQNTTEAFYLNMIFSLLLAFIIAFILISVLKKYYNKLEYLAKFDELTNIPNRRDFHTKFEYLSHLGNRSNKHICLLYIDIDNFKMINDEFGHGVGDNVLKELANILQRNVRKSDLYARWGGEEFIVAFSNITLEKATLLAEKLRQTVEESIKLQNMLHKPTTISIGLTLLKEDDTLESVTSRADKAMYNAKTSGKNRVCIL